MKKILNNTYIILIPIFILNIISIIYLSNTTYLIKHIIYLSISYILLISSTKLNINFILKYIKYLYIISIFLLILVLLIGKEINGSKAWLHILGISIQPSEIAKLTLTLYLSYLTIKNNNILQLFIITIIPSILTFLEPDTGSIIIYIIILISVLKYVKNKKILLTLSLVFIFFIIINITLYFTNKNLLTNIYGPKIFYRLDRLIAFKKQNNIQNINSLISIGSHNLLYIPENHNDFIFASIISKYPSIIFIIIIFSYISILLYYLKNITKEKNISNIINFIILNMFIFQIFYNIFMNLSIVPIIGIPIPFLSYGGSYLTTLYILIGLSINLNSKNNKEA